MAGLALFVIMWALWRVMKGLAAVCCELKLLAAIEGRTLNREKKLLPAGDRVLEAMLMFCMVYAGLAYVFFASLRLATMIT